MEQLIEILKAKFNTLTCVLEVGSRDGHDLKLLKDAFDLNENNIFCIEANPTSYKNIIQTYNYKTFNLAFSNKSECVNFYAIDSENFKGISSLKRRVDGFDIKVKCREDLIIKAIRADEFCKENNLGIIDFCKVDTEGHTYEVLEGFGEHISLVKCFHLEHENVVVWENQKLYSDVKELMIKKGFFEIFNNGSNFQSESIWLNSKYF